jgi:phosphoglycerate kinase
MQEIKSVADADVKGKRVLVHTDFDVPLQDGTVANDARIRAALPTIELLRKNGAQKIILISKLGRPGGKVVEELRMAPVGKRLAELIDTTGIELRENLRFDPREEANDDSFAKELAALGDIFVNEAFADSHRAHASVVGIPKFLPSFAGLRFMEEITRLSDALTPPTGALAIIGGAKFETKIPLIQKLLGAYAQVLLGGALQNDVLRARGFPVGASLTSQVGVPVEVASSERLVVPTDAVMRETDANAERTTFISDIRVEEAIVDIGPQTAAAWAQKIKQAPFVLWNGPMGIYEDGFVDGTDTLAEAVALRAASGQLPQFHAVIGGGDTEAALAKFTFDTKKVFTSTGGGAMLEFLTAGTLPGIEALRQ